MNCCVYFYIYIYIYIYIYLTFWGWKFANFKEILNVGHLGMCRFIIKTIRHVI